MVAATHLKAQCSCASPPGGYTLICNNGNPAKTDTSGSTSGYANTYQRAEKEMNAIYLNSILLGRDKFTAEEAKTIKMYAHSCFAETGRAAALARSLYALIDPEAILLDHEICSQQSRFNQPAIAKDVILGVYPNPANDRLHCIVQSGAEIELSFLDFNGSLVKSVLLSGNTDINVSDLPPGCYFTKATVNGASIFSKLVISR